MSFQIRGPHIKRTYGTTRRAVGALQLTAADARPDRPCGQCSDRGGAASAGAFDPTPVETEWMGSIRDDLKAKGQERLGAVANSLQQPTAWARKSRTRATGFRA